MISNTFVPLVILALIVIVGFLLVRVLKKSK